MERKRANGKERRGPETETGMDIEGDRGRNREKERGRGGQTDEDGRNTDT